MSALAFGCGLGTPAATRASLSVCALTDLGTTGPDDVEERATTPASHADIVSLALAGANVAGASNEAAGAFADAAFGAVADAAGADLIQATLPDGPQPSTSRGTGLPSAASTTSPTSSAEHAASAASLAA